MIGIIDFGGGNLRSVFHAFDSQAIPVEVCTRPGDLHKYESLVLPGVGSFYGCYNAMESKGWLRPIEEEVIAKRKPILGICLGMQLMATKGYEGKETRGLGWFDAEVRRIDFARKVPHVGWNNVVVVKDHPLLAGIPNRADFYFVHSYYFDSNFPGDVVGVSEYEEDFPVVVIKENIMGVQFHPEKSQALGLRLLENFSRLTRP